MRNETAFYYFRISCSSERVLRFKFGSQSIGRRVIGVADNKIKGQYKHAGAKAQVLEFRQPFAADAGCFVRCFLPSVLHNLGLVGAIARRENGPVGQTRRGPGNGSLFRHGSVVCRGGIENPASSDGTFTARRKSPPPDR